jgi:hypothetical protein
MNRRHWLPAIATLTATAALGLWIITVTAAAVPADEASTESTAETSGDKPAAREVPATLEEARGRARLLHETIHGTLQVVHRDFYREGEKLPLPSRTLEDVFAELARTYGVEIRWLAVNAQAMNIDHEPQDDFEKQAAKSLAAGQEEFGAVENGLYRHVGRVRLASECLGCHISTTNRTNSKERSAGLAISVPFRKN